MKSKILLVFVVISFIIVSCSTNHREYTIVYEVYYNENTVVKETKKASEPFYVGSDRGSNFIKIGSLTGELIISTSAPIRVLSHTYKEYEQDNRSKAQ